MFNFEPAQSSQRSLLMMLETQARLKCFTPSLQSSEGSMPSKEIYRPAEVGQKQKSEDGSQKIHADSGDGCVRSGLENILTWY